MQWSHVYRYSVNPEVFVDENNINDLRLTLTDPISDTQVAELNETLTLAHQWREQQNAVWLALFNTTSVGPQRDRLVNSLLTQAAPMVSVFGCWLQNMSAPGVFEQSYQLKQMALLADDIGVGQPHASRYDEFKRLQQRFGLNDHAQGPFELSFLTTIDDSFFALPGAILAMSRRSDAFGPELCGVDVVLRTIGLLPAFHGLKQHSEQWINWSRLDLSMAGNPTVVSSPTQSSAQIAAYYCQQSEALNQRIRAGAAWCLAAVQGWHQALTKHATNAIDPAQAMAKLLQARSRDAAVYHHQYKLAGCPLSGWFKTAAENPEPLLAAIANSALVRPGNAARSSLVTNMVAENGQMFRIFTDTELATMRQWIDALPPRGQQAKPTVAAAAPLATESNQPVCPHAANAATEDKRNSATNGSQCPIQSQSQSTVKVGDLSLGAEPQNLRQAYCLLQGRALAPKTREFAINYVENWLADIRRSSQNDNSALPKVWPQQGLSGWLADQHDKHGESYRKDSDNDMPSREDAIDSSLQLAPLILIDGGWLQGFTDVHLASSAIGYSLFEIYWDELGNGDYAINHPKIYRDLLIDMGVELAPTGSWEFAHDQRLDDDSFRLPVLWLAMGKLPQTFLPEILGMNLAMELSGVGDGYLFASRFLKHHGFSTRFVDLHNTIDNVATGHSAWAAQAIDHYMRHWYQQNDHSAIATHWQRISNGFKSMTTMPSKISRRSEKLFTQAPATMSNLSAVPLFHHQWANVESI